MILVISGIIRKSKKKKEVPLVETAKFFPLWLRPVTSTLCEEITKDLTVAPILSRLFFQELSRNLSVYVDIF